MVVHDHGPIGTTRWLWAVSALLVACGERVAETGEPLTWRLDSLFTVGSLEGPDAFGRVQSILADAEGRLYVGDAQANAIPVFDSTGARVGVIGRAGRGPGEMTRLQSLAWLGDTLAVMDAGNARIGLFDRQGSWLGQFAHQALTGPALGVRFHRAAGAGAWAMQIDRAGKRVSRRAGVVTPARSRAIPFG